MTEVAVVGAGLMGHALALVYALGGHEVRLTDNRAETLQRAAGLMTTALATLVEAGEVDASWNGQRLSHAVRCIPSLVDTVAGAKLVVEAIVERPDAKRAVYTELEGLIDTDAILASNTSNLDIFPLLPDGLQQRTIIAHWSQLHAADAARSQRDAGCADRRRPHRRHVGQRLFRPGQPLA